MVVFYLLESRMDLSKRFLSAFDIKTYSSRLVTILNDKNEFIDPVRRNREFTVISDRFING